MIESVSVESLSRFFYGKAGNGEEAGQEKY